jgi:16S rRNA (cytosine1402-N4)-methyltransferase
VSTTLLEMPSTHTPVLAEELLGLLHPAHGQTAIDCTFGGGGHARLVAERLGADGTLIAIDRDPLAQERAAALADEVRCEVRFIRAGYAEALERLADEDVHADVVYFDLGMSSMQVDTRERGFSYAYEAPLDMRMDPDQELNASAIVAESTLELVEVINSAIPTPARFAGSHPAKRVFQALRIAVNDELGQLDRALPLAWGRLREGGVLAAISFHSLEDRRVKRFLGARAQGCICPPDLPVCACGREPEASLLSRRALMPSAAEIARNPRSTSARLRGAIKLIDTGGEA